MLNVLVFALLAVFLLTALVQQTLWHDPARYLTGEALEGFTTVILLQLFTGTLLMFSLGIIGYYLAKIYDEVKRRPRYVIAETLDDAP